MHQIPDHGINDPDVHSDEEYVLPSVEALLAGTLALMTGHAQACCDRHRELMARKAASNLLVLSKHPLMSHGFHCAAGNLHGRWLQQSQADQAQGLQANADAASPDRLRALWHRTSEVIQ
jgi:hypothetical protein